MSIFTFETMYDCQVIVQPRPLCSFRLILSGDNKVTDGVADVVIVNVASEMSKTLPGSLTEATLIRHWPEGMDGTVKVKLPAMDETGAEFR